MHLLNLFKELTIRPKNAQKLKGLILQLAVQGELTANWRKENKDVEPASELLKRIQKEKDQLIKDKKIKKEKPLPSITKDEIPYKLPDGWVWCRLNEVCEYIQRGKSPKYTEIPKIPVVSQKCVQWSGFDISRAKFITEESLEKYGEERFLQFGDLLWNSTGNGTIGRVISFPKTNFNNVVADSHVTVVRSFKKYVLTDYLWIFTASPLIQTLVVGRVTGSTNQTELGTATVKSMEFSFPPLEEQKAIVRVVETLFKEVEQLEQLTVERITLKEKFVTSALDQLTTNNAKNEWAFLQEHFKSFFNETGNIKKLRETVLQLAVQGKLTADWRANNPDKEDASVLLKLIQKEKDQLIKDKKLKKEKPFLPITKDEIPYELPESWLWCRLGDVLETLSDYHANGSYKVLKEKTQLLDEENYAIMIRTTNFHERNRTNYKYITKEAYNFLDKSKVFPCDIIMNKIGDPGTVFWVDDRGKPMSLAMNLFLLRASNYGSLSRIVYLYLIGNVTYVKSFAAGTSTQTITKDAVKGLVFPLPPLEEQKAIVQKVNALMGLCDTLEQELQQSQGQSEQLMQSVLREVFEGNLMIIK